MPDEIHELLTGSLRDVEDDEVWSIIEERARRLRLRRRVALVVSVVTGLAMVAALPVLLDGLSDESTPIVGTPDGPSPPLTDSTPEAGGSIQLQEVEGNGVYLPVPYLDPADDAAEFSAGIPDVLWGSVGGSTVSLSLAERVDRQQAPNLLVADPRGEVAVYYSATIGLDDCVDQAGKCTVRHAIRRADLRAGTEEMVVDDAFSFAVRRDGTMATVLLDPEGQTLGDPPRGRIAVGSPSGGWEPWTSDVAGYHVVGWAGPHLLVQVDRFTDTEGGDDVIVLTGPNAVRRLVPDADGRVHLIASSPDGAQALVQQQAGGDCCGSRVLLVDVSTGTVLDQMEYNAPGWLASGRGVWLNDSTAVLAVFDDRHAGLQMLEVGDGALGADRVRVLGERNETNVYWLSSWRDGTVVAMLGGAGVSGRFEATYASCEADLSGCRIHDVGFGPEVSYLAR